MRDLFKIALQKNVDIVKNPDSTIDEVKVVVCGFFRGGGHPDCQGCDQNEFKVRECGRLYTDRILDRPMPRWAPAFSEILVPDKQIPVGELAGIGLVCDDCYIKDKCPVFKSGSACSVDFSAEESAHHSTTKGMDYLIRLQMTRVERARAFELMDGGIPDQNMSAEMDRLMTMLQTRSDMDTVKFSQETKFQVPGMNQEGKQSILAQFFKPKGQQQVALPEAQPVIDVPATVTTKEPEVIERKPTPRVIPKRPSNA